MSSMTDIVAVRQSYYPETFVARVIDAIVGIIEVALAIRIALELFGASSSSQFVAWIYGVTATFIGPFSGAFSGLPMGPNATIDIVAILAMIGYAILGWLLIRILQFVFTSLSFS